MKSNHMTSPHHFRFTINQKSKTKDQVPPTVWSSGSFISYNLCHVVENSLERSGNGRAVGSSGHWAAWLDLWLCEWCGSPVVPKAYYYFAGDCRVMKEQPRLASERRCLSVPSKKGGNEKDICCIWAIILSHLMSRKIVICNLLLFRPRQPSFLKKPGNL